MASPETENPPAETGLAAKVEQIEDKINQLFEMLKGGGAGDRGSETEPQAEASMSAEIRRELEKLQREEAARQKEAERDAQVNDLKEKVAAIPERAPREYRKSTERMGWVTEKDR